MTKPPIRSLTEEEQKTKPKTCYGCGRDAITWCESKKGLLGYCGYLDSGACLALIENEREND